VDCTSQCKPNILDELGHGTLGTGTCKSPWQPPSQAPTRRFTPNAQPSSSNDANMPRLRFNLKPNFLKRLQQRRRQAHAGLHSRAVADAPDIDVGAATFDAYTGVAQAAAPSQQTPIILATGPERNDCRMSIAPTALNEGFSRGITQSNVHERISRNSANEQRLPVPTVNHSMDHIDHILPLYHPSSVHPRRPFRFRDNSNVVHVTGGTIDRPREGNKMDNLVDVVQQATRVNFNLNVRWDRRARYRLPGVAPTVLSPAFFFFPRRQMKNSDSVLAD